MKRIKILTSAVAVFLLLGVGTLVSQYSESRSNTRNMLLLTDVLHAVSEHYVDPIPTEDLVLGAIEGLVESLDMHSQLLDQRHHERLMEQTKGQFGGIGIEISIRDDSLTVLAPIPGTPAHKVGLQSGDRIVRIEDEQTFGMELQEAVSRLKGEPGTLVNIWVSRIGVEDPIHFPITRAIIKIESIQGKFMLTPEVGYVRLGVFSDKSGREVVETIAELKAMGMKKLIFDLRDNPGGLLSRAVDVADVFLEPGQVIVSTRGRISNANQVFKARRQPLWEGGALVCMINRGSASASEIVSGALQDHDKAVIIGSTSYGKGSVQTVIDLRDNYAIKLTTAKYYTPSGRCIHSDDHGGDVHHGILVPEDTLQTYTTDTGRIVRGGGGITPDLIVRDDSLSEAERKIYSQAGKFRNMMFRFAVEYKNEHPEMVSDSLDSVSYAEHFNKEIVEITPDLLARVEGMLEEEGFELTHEEFENAGRLIHQWMYYYIADACYDRNTAQRAQTRYDDELQQALELIRDTAGEGDFVQTVLAGRTLPDTLEVYSVAR